MQSARGNALRFMDIRPEQIDIVEIATVLARLPRFTGHYRMDIIEAGYSVAQHSVIVSHLAPDPVAGLMHDVHEFIVGDMGTPLKAQLEDLCPGFRKALYQLTDRIDQAVCEAFLLDPRTLHSQETKIADLKALATEKRDLMAPPPEPWIELPDPAEEVIQPMTTRQARDAFLARFYELELHTRS